MKELDLVRNKIREDLNELADFIATGGAPDFPAYRQMVGKIEGLAMAERHILDLVERIMKDADL